MQAEVTIDRKRVMHAVARFNREVLNPFTLSFAGRAGSPYSIIRHVGRKSGKTYATPVLAARTDEGFVIPMPHGAHSDWHQNIQAAGEAIIVHQGRAYRVAQPEVVGTGEGTQAFGPVLAWMLEGTHTESFLRLTPDDDPLDGAAYANTIADYPIDHAIKVGAVAVAILVILRRRGRRRRRRHRRRRRRLRDRRRRARARRTQ